MLEKIGKKAMPTVTWQDCQKELEEIVNKRKDEYAEEFRKARIQSARLVAERYMHDNPFTGTTEEEREEYKNKLNVHVKDYVDNSPSELERSLRVYCNLGTALFNQLSNINAQLADFKELYMAINEKGIQEFATNHKDEIEAQQKAMAQAEENARRKQRAQENKAKLDKKLGK